MLDGEHFARASEAGDHLVADQQRADVGRERAQLAQVTGWRDDVAGGALHRLHDDRGDVVGGFERDLGSQEVHAMPRARRERLAECAARAGCVGARIGSGRERTQAVLEASRQERQHAARLAVKAAPEPHDLVPAGGRSREPHGGFDRFRAARIELGAVEVAGRDPGNQLDESGAMLRREAADVHPFELFRHLGDVAGMRVAEARDADAGEQIDIAIAVDVPQDRAFAAVHAQLAEKRDTLRARRQVLRLEVEDAPRLRLCSEIDHPWCPLEALSSM